MDVNGTNLSMMRGDSDSLTVNCMDGDIPRPFEDGDIVGFTVRYGYDTQPPIIEKTATTFRDGAAVFDFAPEETQELQPGKYIYDIQLTESNGRVTTIIEPSNFELRGDVTHV